VTTAMEIDTLPPLKHLRETSRFGGAAIFVVLAICCGVLIAPAAVKIGLDWSRAPKDLVNVGAGQPDATIDVEPAHSVTVRNNTDAPVMMNVVAAAPHRVVSEGSANAGSPERKFRVEGNDTQTVCVDHCPDDAGWYTVDQWLPALVSPATSLSLHTLGPPIYPGPNEPLTLTDAGLTPDRLTAGIIYLFEFSGRRHLVPSDILISGTGSYGSPAKLALYSVQADGNYERLRRYQALTPGKYVICVYFSSFDEAGCNPSADKRAIFEGGIAVLNIPRRPQ
jgi:hypothetical protein